MKVLLVNKYWYIRGGAERVVFATKDILEKNGHEVEIFGMKHSQNILDRDYFIPNIDYASVKGFKKISSACKSIYNRDAKNKFAKLVEDLKPDVVHFHNIYHQLSFSLLDVVKQKNISSVMTLHDYKMISPNYNLFHHGKIDESSCGRNYYKCLFNNCMESPWRSLAVTIEAYLSKWKKWNKKIDVYITPSKFLKDKFVSVGFENKIEVINNPLVGFDFKSKIFVGKDILYMGRLSEEKGVKLVLEMAEKFPDAPFKIAGDGPLKKFLEKTIEHKKLKNVELLGYLTGDNLHNTLLNARLLLLPSQWYENYPLSVLEAHAMGKVVLAHDLGGLVEMIPREMLVDHKDKNAWLQKIDQWYNKTDKELAFVAKDLRDNIIKENNIDVYYKRLIKVYEQIAK
ncbi:MAG: glycosyltransferase [Patescibacteria group bacterium]|nr:glycosyltransferase [Patescibacteria group bacterium]